MASATMYIAVFLSEASSDAPGYDSVYEVSFVLLNSASMEEAFELAKGMEEVKPTYVSVSGYSIVWAKKLVSVGPVPDESLAHGSEVYSRYFRNAEAYSMLQFEDFSVTRHFPDTGLKPRG